MTHLDEVSVEYSTDPAKRNLELYCDLCHALICDVQPGDTVEVLASMARDHVCVPVEPWNHPGHKEVQHRDRRRPWCNVCGWRAPVPAIPARPAEKVK